MMSGPFKIGAVLAFSSLAILIIWACLLADRDSQVPIKEDVHQDVSLPPIDSVEKAEVLPNREETFARDEALKTQTNHTSSKKLSAAHSTGNRSSYASSNHSAIEEDDDYWEEKRKHSPNDNYLLGFDEDVDDVHDMEIYMEDY